MNNGSVLPLALLGLLSPPLPSPLLAQPPSLVLDLNQLAGGVTGSAPQSFVTLGDRVVFGAFEPATGVELWASDGTAEGTELLADATPGPGMPDVSPPPYAGTGGGLLYWSSPEIPSGPLVLWRTDGTSAGTFPLLRYPSPLNVFAQATSAQSGRHFFLACGHERTDELWMSDGTVEGSGKVLDLPADRDCSVGAEMVMLGERIFFWLGHPTEPRAWLWTSDGTAEGTREMLDFQGLRGLVASESTLFFEALTGRGWELWASDGTRPGTRVASSFRARDPFKVRTGIVNFDIHTPVIVDGRAIVAAHDEVTGLWLELYAYPGPGVRARRLTDLTSAGATLTSTVHSTLFQRGGLLVFAAYSDAHGLELWRTNGNPQSTRQVLDLCPGPCSGIDELFSSRVATLGDHLYFRGSDGTGHNQLFASDGTVEGTVEVRPGGGFEVLSEPRSLAGEVYFVAHTPQSGNEIWKVSPASPLVPVPVTDLAAPEPFPAHYVFLGGPGGFLGASAGRIFFAASDELHGSELWMSEGEPETTAFVADVAKERPGSSPRSVVGLGSRAIFTAFDGVGEGVWASDGSTGTTVRLTPQDAASPCANKRPEALTPVAGSVFFLCDRDFFEPDQLWRTDGTPGGTALVADLVGVVNAGQFHWTPFGSRLYFPVFTENGEEVWESDGTAAGTRRAFALESVSYTNLIDMAATPTRLYAATTIVDEGTGQSISRLWRSDGSDAGTVRLFNRAQMSIEAASLVPVGEEVLFVVSTGEGSALWRSDGTPAGTLEVAELGGRFLSEVRAYGDGVALLAYHLDASFQPVDLSLWTSDGTAGGTRLVAELGRLPSAPDGVFGGELTVVGEQAFFRAEDDEHGAELWVSDGTTEGTRLVSDLVPGTGSANPTRLTAAGGRLFFSATDGVSGFELWVSDGTAAGTRRVSDLQPGMFSSVPRELAEVGSRLFWSADDGVHGRELWSAGLGGL